MSNSPIKFESVDALLMACNQAVDSSERLFIAARQAMSTRTQSEATQHETHGLAWLATYVEALRQLAGWANRLHTNGQLREMEQCILQFAFAEYLTQIVGGISMTQGEIIRVEQLGTPAADIEWFTSETQALRASLTPCVKARIAELMLADISADTFGDCGLDDEMSMVRTQFRRFANNRVLPYAHEWHLQDKLIPMDVIDEMAALGVFGLTIPEEYGGADMGKTAMCVVSEELSRAYIGVGSLGTRSEIAAELILGGGTNAQKAYWLPKLATGEVLPTAVFTEPNTGSDLGALHTRATGLFS